MYQIALKKRNVNNAWCQKVKKYETQKFQILDESNKNSLVFDHFRLSAINLGCSCIDFLYFFLWL